MPKITSKYLLYTYSKKATPGDDPKKTADDANHLSRKEEYEVIDFINSFNGPNRSDLTIPDRQAIEWMIHEHMPKNIQGQERSSEWIIDNYDSLRPKFKL